MSEPSRDPDIPDEVWQQIKKDELLEVEQRMKDWLVQIARAQQRIGVRRITLMRQERGDVTITITKHDEEGATSTTETIMVDWRGIPHEGPQE